MIEKIDILGKSVSLFYLFWLLAIVVAFLVGYAIRKRYDFSFSKCTAYVGCDMVFGVLFIFGTSWVFGGGKMSGLHFLRIVPFMWMYFILLAWFLKDPYHKVFDLLTTVGAFLFVIARIGCIFPGCCHGYPSDWGLYSNAAGTICFPTQIIECCIGLVIAFILLIMGKQQRFQGKIYPWYLVMFGSTRFILEFFRDNDKLFWQVSKLSLFAAASVFLGIFILMYQKSKEERSSNNEVH